MELIVFIIVFAIFIAATTYLRVPLALSPMVGLPCIILIVYLSLVFQLTSVIYAIINGFLLLTVLLFCYNAIRLRVSSYAYYSVVVCALLVYLFLATRNNSFGTHDGLVFWALRANAIFMHASLPLKSAYGGHLEYPLASPIWQALIFHYVGYYASSWALWAYNILLVTPFLSIFLLKPKLKAFAIFVFMLAFYYLVELYAFCTILVDNLITSWTFGILCVFYALKDQEKFYFLYYLLPAFALLVLIKSIGFLFALLAICIIFVELIRQNALKKAAYPLMALLLCVFFVKLAWSAYVHHAGYPITFDLLAELLRAKTWQTVFWSSSTFHQDVLFVFVYKFLLMGDVVPGISPGFLLILLVAIYLYQKTYLKGAPTLPCASVWFVFLVFGIVYFVGLLILMSTQFLHNEALLAMGLGRYSRTLFLLIFMLIAILYFNHVDFSVRAYKILICFSLMVLSLPLFFQKNHFRYFVQFNRVRHFLTARGLDPASSKLLYLWEVKGQSESKTIAQIPAAIYHSIYYPKVYNRNLHGCYQIYFDSLNEACHYSVPEFLSEIQRRKLVIVLVRISHENAVRLGVNSKLSLYVVEDKKLQPLPLATSLPTS